MLVIAISLLLASSSQATKLAGEFLTTGFGAKALGMGGAFASLADDASAVYWNPAGLVQLDRSQLLLMHSERFGNLVDYNCFSLSRPLSRAEGKEASGAISLIWLRVSDIPFTSHLDDPNEDFIDANGNKKWDPGERRLWNRSRIRWESDNEIAGFLSYSRRINPKTSGGLNIKVIWKEIADISALGLGLDAGLLYEPMSNWRVGMNIQDLTTTPLYWDGWYYTFADTVETKQDVSTKETIYPTLKLGTSYTLPVASISGNLVFAADVDLKFEGLRGDEVDFWAGDISADVRLGLLYQYLKNLRVSIGMDRQKPTAGIGLTIAQFGLDYAFWRDDDLDNTHRISASMDF